MKKAVVYLAAGISNRYGGKIKSLVEVGPKGETLMEVSINQALKAGFDEIIFVVGNKTEGPFKEKFGESYNGVPVKYAYQKYDESERDKPWGTTDALCSVKEVIGGPFVVCNGDELFGEEAFRKMYKSLDSGEEGVIAYPLGDMVPNEGSVNRGIFTVVDGYVTNIEEFFNVEKEKMDQMNLSEDDLCNVNVFALHPQVVEMLHEGFVEFKERNKGDRKIESLLPRDLSDLIKRGKINMRLFTVADKWIGITNPGDEAAVREFLRAS